MPSGATTLCPCPCVLPSPSKICPCPPGASTPCPSVPSQSQHPLSRSLSVSLSLPVPAPAVPVLCPLSVPAVAVPVVVAVAVTVPPVPAPCVPQAAREGFRSIAASSISQGRSQRDKSLLLLARPRLERSSAREFSLPCGRSRALPGENAPGLGWHLRAPGWSEQKSGVPINRGKHRRGLLFPGMWWQHSGRSWDRGTVPRQGRTLHGHRMSCRGHGAVRAALSRTQHRGAAKHHQLLRE